MANFAQQIRTKKYCKDAVHTSDWWIKNLILDGEIQQSGKRRVPSSSRVHSPSFSFTQPLRDTKYAEQLEGALGQIRELWGQL